MNYDNDKAETLYYHSPIGILKIQGTNDAIYSVQFVSEYVSTQVQSQLLHNCVEQLQEYFAHRRKVFDLPLSPQGTPFRQAVWNALRNIPYGETHSYKAIARTIGNEKAVRAVGGACGDNPICILIPCHRVVGSDGSLTGFAYGVNMKMKLLELEINT